MQTLLFGALLVGVTLGKSVENLQDPHQRLQEEHAKAGGRNADLDHQSILGSKDTAKEFDELPPEEAKRRLRILAGKMDKNGDQTVDKDELTDWIHDSLRALDEDEARERFPEMDANKDGSVDFDEYVKENFSEEDLDDDDTKKFVDEDRAYFNAADRDANGKLSAGEYAAFQRPENHPHMQEAMILITLKEKDKNKDGQLTFDEFTHGIDAEQEAEWFKVEKERFEEDYDKDKNGVLDKEEIRAWLAPDVKQSAREEAEHIMHETAPKASSLTFDQIVAKHELWVGSEATGYGKHLDEL